MPRVQSPLHQPSCRLSSGSTNSVGMCVEFPPYLDLVFVFVFVFRHVEIGIKEHAPPHQPLSMSGQGVGKFEQSFLSGHHGAPACLHTWGTTITQSYECILLRGTFFVFVFFSSKPLLEAHSAPSSRQRRPSRCCPCGFSAPGCEPMSSPLRSVVREGFTKTSQELQMLSRSSFILIFSSGAYDCLLRFILTFSKGVSVCSSVTFYPHF